MINPLFSIIIVTLNAEAEVNQTIKSIHIQECCDYEVIIKDGGSKDNTLNLIPDDKRYRVFVEADRSVYDGMNQAIDYAVGRFIIFMNAGDMFYDSQVLSKIKTFIEYDSEVVPYVLYGNYSRNKEYIQNQKSVLNDFLLYRRPLCHQTILYSRELFSQYGKLNTKYKISADHDLTLRLWRSGVPFKHTGTIICTYLGGGLSETEKGLKQAKAEKAEIVKLHYSVRERLKYNAIIFCSFSGVRAWLDSQKSPIILRNAYRKLRNKAMK